MNEGGWNAALDKQRAAINDKSAILDAIGMQVVLPMLARRYDESGLKKRTGIMKQAIAIRGAPGNIYQIDGNRLTVGVDYAVVPQSKWQLEGTLPHEIRPKKPGGVLRFYWARIGKWVTLKRVWHPGTRARLIYRMDQADIDKASDVANAMVSGEVGSVRVIR